MKTPLTTELLHKWHQQTCAQVVIHSHRLMIGYKIFLTHEGWIDLMRDRNFPSFYGRGPVTLFGSQVEIRQHGPEEIIASWRDERFWSSTLYRLEHSGHERSKPGYLIYQTDLMNLRRRNPKFDMKPERLLR